MIWQLNKRRSRGRSRKKRKKKNIQHEEIKGTTDETRNNRIERETVQHNYKNKRNYNTNSMIMIQTTMEN